MNNNKKIEERQKDFIYLIGKNWKIVSVMIFASVLRIYYFLQTKGQALWYDEGEYMSTAKYFAFDVPFTLNPQRPPMFQYIASLFLRAGISESVIIFVIVVIPSILLVYSIYLLGKEMFNENIGLIAGLLSSVSWTFLFWTNRFQPDFLSMNFQVLAILFMWKFWKKQDSKTIVYAGIFSGLGLHFKVSALLVPLSFLIFIYLKEGFSAIKNKYYYYYSGAFISTLIPYFIWAWIIFRDPLAFRAGYSNELVNHVPFGWYNINFYYNLTEGIVFVLFLIGFILALRFILYLDILIKDRKKFFDAEIFSILVLLTVSAFYIFYMRNTDDRWVYLWIPFIFYLVGSALIFLYNLTKSKGKNVALIIVLTLLFWGTYAQLSHGDNIIDIKKESYAPVRDAGLWLKENMIKGEKTFSISYPQIVAYSENIIFNCDGFKSEEAFKECIDEEKPQYFMVSVFENHPDYIHSWINENVNKLSVVQAYFADAEKKQPVLILYKVNYGESND
jgi:hypothetical protein